MRHLVTFSVEGRPASFATSHEPAWKEAVAAAVEAQVPSPWPHERFSVRIEFRTSPPTGAGEVWDLDNLIKPTLDAMAGVFGARAWRGFRSRPTIAWTTSTRASGSLSRTSFRAL